MKTTKALFSELMYDFQSERWNEFELPKALSSELVSDSHSERCPARRPSYAEDQDFNFERAPTSLPNQTAMHLAASRIFRPEN
jgi:hypothetical protein